MLTAIQPVNVPQRPKEGSGRGVPTLINAAGLFEDDVFSV